MIAKLGTLSSLCLATKLNIPYQPNSMHAYDWADSADISNGRGYWLG